MKKTDLQAAKELESTNDDAQDSTSVSHSELLEATVRHIEDLKERGVRYVPVDPEVWKDLSRPQVARRRERPSKTQLAAPVSVAEESPAVVAESSASIAPWDSADHPPLSRADKEAAFERLRAQALECQKCPHLARSRRSVVFGVGDIHSPLLFVGEAPGADEDIQGEPFVGKAGQLLTKIIQAMSLSRETVYIGNVLKCRPDTPGQTSGNRKPTPDEMKTCLPYLLAQIELIRPKVIVALGATAMEGLFGKPIPITKIRGRFIDFRGTPVMPTYHPSYLLRNEAPAVKRQVWEDMLQVMEKLEMPITDKQRGFFLKGG